MGKVFHLKMCVIYPTWEPLEKISPYHHQELSSFFFSELKATLEASSSSGKSIKIIDPWSFFYHHSDNLTWNNGHSLRRNFSPRFPFKISYALLRSEIELSRHFSTSSRLEKGGLSTVDFYNSHRSYSSSKTVTLVYWWTTYRHLFAFHSDQLLWKRPEKSPKNVTKWGQVGNNRASKM